MFNLGGEFPPHKSYKIMKKQNYKYPISQIECNEQYQCETIEEKLRKATTTNEPIESTMPEIYTERKDGVLPQYDIRTDRFDIALDAQTKADKIQMAQREEAAKKQEEQQQNKTE